MLKYKKIFNKKAFFLVLLFLIVLTFILFWGSIEKVFSKATDAAYCTSCHMMKPEQFTWQASSHSQVQCIQCHAPPGVLKKAKYNLFTIKEWYAAFTGNYGILILQTEPIPDANCNQCHDMNSREVTPSGDLIIPHDKHASKDISCTSCHSGVAHGNIAKKKVTFRSDYNKWDDSMGRQFMSDIKNIRPNMDTCMQCHKVRNAPLNCSACHKTSMIPEDHKSEAFKQGRHGKTAVDQIQTCDSCHSYMSKEKVEVTQGNESKYQEFLNNDTGKKVTTISVTDYAKSNTFCKDCHAKRPSSHQQDLFLMKHGLIADQNEGKCFTCHDNRVLGDSPVTKISCGSCHPSTHSKRDWKKAHPVDLPEKPEVTDMCYVCHVERTCLQCHKATKKK
jgi:nitrate/TMAO reductase-like tetraheme cytochrome c subunit